MDYQVGKKLDSSSVILSGKARGNNWPMELLFEDEELQLAIREYATGAKDNMLI